MKRLKTACLIASAVLCISPCASADGDGASITPNANYQMSLGLVDCLAEAGGKAEAKRACYEIPMKLADEALAGALNQFLTADLSEQTKAEFKITQVEWLRFREINCNFWGGLPLNDDAWPVSPKEYCYMELTIKRTNELADAKLFYLPIPGRVSTKKDSGS